MRGVALCLCVYCITCAAQRDPPTAAPPATGNALSADDVFASLTPNEWIFGDTGRIDPAGGDCDD